MKFSLDEVQAIVESGNETPTGDPFLDTRYEAHRAKFGHPNLYWRTFYRLCEFLHPSFCVELGAWQGTCAAHMAPHSGIVATIDHHTDPGDDENRRLTLEVSSRYSQVLYLQGWTWDKVHEVRELGIPIDLLFVDSWHQYEYAILDWSLFSPLLADEALVVCDDLLPTDGPVIAGMQKFWNEISNGRQAFVSKVPHAGFPMGFIQWTR